MSDDLLSFDSWWDRRDASVHKVNFEHPVLREVAKAAFDAGVAQSRNYTADHESRPSEVSFANGRSVKVTGGGGFLKIT